MHGVRGLDEDVRSLIETLREIDRLVDIARGEVQLLILLSAKRDLVRPTLVAESLGLRTKTVVDAVQKLKRKGLLKKLGKDRYRLTDKGRRLRELIFNLPRATAVLGSRDAVYGAYIISEAVLVLGTTGEEWYPLRRLAEHVGVNPGRLRRILGLSKLFKLRDTPHGEEVALSYDGQRLYEELLRRRGLGPTVARALSILTFTPDPRKALTRFFAAYLVISTLVIFEVLATTLGSVEVASLVNKLLPSFVAAMTWLATSVYLAILVLAKR